MLSASVMMLTYDSRGGGKRWKIVNQGSQQIQLQTQDQTHSTHTDEP